jgi:hypothetical protein
MTRRMRSQRRGNTSIDDAPPALDLFSLFSSLFLLLQLQQRVAVNHVAIFNQR